MKSIIFSFSILVTLFFFSGCVSQDVRYENRQNRILKKIEREAKKEEERIKRNSVPVAPGKKSMLNPSKAKTAPKILYDK